MELRSQTFIPTTKETPKGAEAVSHALSLRAGLLHMVSAGIYTYLPLGYKVLRNIEEIVRGRMEQTGAQELFMPALQPLELWQKTGRDKDLEEVMLHVQDRKGRKLCLGPTHEELITEIASKYISSYKQLPVTLYQIQTKYRDEMRPRFGLVRGCEFMMKDAYSFDADESGLNASYEKMLDAYQKIFTECGLEYVVSEADPGAMGGNVSHEFMVPAEIGEDMLYACAGCGLYAREAGQCEHCGQALSESRMIEIGHVFKLGTKYSVPLQATFLDQHGKRNPLVMGCYGIGVSRLLSAIIETNHDEKGIIWPARVSPYRAVIVVLNQEFIPQARRLAERIETGGGSVLIDDRNESAGVKFRDAQLLGIPRILVMGRTFADRKEIEVESRADGERSAMSPDAAAEHV
ncbi:MAG: proline--tRNA ligase [Candidatus Omnitrophica bacterium]|nr:proline--tRNA ligase [Candidatus Omnitrophota bacterium]